MLYPIFLPHNPDCLLILITSTSTVIPKRYRCSCEKFPRRVPLSVVRFPNGESSRINSSSSHGSCCHESPAAAAGSSTAEAGSWSSMTAAAALLLSAVVFSSQLRFDMAHNTSCCPKTKSSLLLRTSSFDSKPFRNQTPDPDNGSIPQLWRERSHDEDYDELWTGGGRSGDDWHFVYIWIIQLLELWWVLSIILSRCMKDRVVDDGRFSCSIVSMYKGMIETYSERFLRQLQAEMETNGNWFFVASIPV